MAYTSDTAPDGLTALTSLVDADWLIVGDQSDSVEEVKVITKANFLIDIFNGPTLVAPVLGTPASGTLTNCDGYVGDASLVTVGALNSGSIASGFGNIDNGSSNLTSGGTVTLGAASLIIPASDGNSGEFMQTDGAGNLTFGPVTAGSADSVVDAVYNASGGTLTKGTPVYISGYNVGQNLIEVDQADANGSGTMPAIGIITADVTNNSSGSVTVYGELTGLDTSSYSVGDALYVSETVGTLTNTKPTGTTSGIQKVAIVTRSHVSLGVILVIGAGRTNDVPNDIDVVGHIYGTEVDDGNSSTADTIDWGAGNFHKSTMTGNCTYTFTAPDGDGRFQLMLVQDGTGSRTATWPAAVKWPSGTAPTLSTAANSIDIITFYYDGTSYYGVDSLDFS